MLSPSGVVISLPGCTAPFPKTMTVRQKSETGLIRLQRKPHIFARKPQEIGDCSLFLRFSQGFLQSEVLGEVSVLEEGQFGAKFFTKLATKFFTKFSGWFCWDIQSKKKLLQKLQP